MPREWGEGFLSPQWANWIFLFGSLDIQLGQNGRWWKVMELQKGRSKWRVFRNSAARSKFRKPATPGPFAQHRLARECKMTLLRLSALLCATFCALSCWSWVSSMIHLRWTHGAVPIFNFFFWSSNDIAICDSPTRGAPFPQGVSNRWTKTGVGSARRRRQSRRADWANRAGLGPSGAQGL